MKGYLHIYRPLNVLFIALAQVLCAYFLDASAQFYSITTGGVFWLVTGTAACAAFGYWINDMYDGTRDFVNHGKSSFLHQLNPLFVYTHLLLFVLVALYAGNELGLWFVGLFVATMLVLFSYSRWLKNIALVGNSSIAMVCFYSIFSVYVLFKTIDFLLILHFALLAAGVTLCREIVKDAEDMEGDRQTGAKTLPIIWGLNTTNLIVYAIILTIIPVAIVTLYAQKSYFSGALVYLYYTYSAIFILIPLFKVAVDVRYAKEKEEYTRLSLWLKYVFFTGILSLLFF